MDLMLPTSSQGWHCRWHYPNFQSAFHFGKKLFDLATVLAFCFGRPALPFILVFLHLTKLKLRGLCTHKHVHTPIFLSPSLSVPLIFAWAIQGAHRLFFNWQVSIKYHKTTTNPRPYHLTIGLVDKHGTFFPIKYFEL